MTTIPESAIQQVRAAIQSLPELAASDAGRPPDVEDVYYPPGHAEALDPLRALVVGNRGVGKSFWVGALTRPEIRLRIAEEYPHAGKLRDLARYDVMVAFPGTGGNPSAPSKEVLASLSEFPEELIWKAVIARTVAERVGFVLPGPTLRDTLGWATRDPEAVQRLYRQADDQLHHAGRPLLVLFDELDRLADDWTTIQRLTQGVLRLALSLTQFRAIRAKIFMRPDQANNRSLFQFPDASKLSGQRLVLEWRNEDLYGLFFQRLLRDPNARHALRMFDPIALRRTTEAQQGAFIALAGEFMRGEARTGSTYAWVPTHLADARDEVSPRIFLKALKAAAEYEPSPAERVFDVHALQDGVRKASTHRLEEIGEDYPWVTDALKPLRGLLVPCDPAAVHERWREHRTATEILARYQGTRAPLELESASPAGAEEALTRALQEIGVLEVRETGRYNFPDIFRVDAGIKRKGGLSPTRRRR